LAGEKSLHAGIPVVIAVTTSEAQMSRNARL